MSTANEPEPLLCAECGRPLSAPTAPCLLCEGPDGGPDPPGAMEALRLQRKGRILVMFGFWSMPWLFGPLAAHTARRGLTLVESSTDPDPRMARGFRRIFVLGLLLLGLYLVSVFVTF